MSTPTPPTPPPSSAAPAGTSSFHEALERAAALGKEWRPPGQSDSTAVLARAAAEGKEWRPPVDNTPAILRATAMKHWVPYSQAHNLAIGGLFVANERRTDSGFTPSRNVPLVGTQWSAPLLPGADPNGRCMAVVEFKRKRFRKYEAPRDVLVGSHVMVDSDRGTDIGLVVRVIRYGADGNFTVAVMGGVDVPLDKVIQSDGRLIREARPDEIHALYSWLPLLEQQALNACRLRAIYHQLHISIVDCEIQFDSKKVSFYFDAPPGTVVDFRELVRDLYSLYKARIWMENINPKGPVGTTKEYVPSPMTPQKQPKPEQKSPKPAAAAPAKAVQQPSAAKPTSEKTSGTVAATTPPAAPSLAASDSPQRTVAEAPTTSDAQEPSPPTS